MKTLELNNVLESALDEYYADESELGVEEAKELGRLRLRLAEDKHKMLVTYLKNNFTVSR